MENKDFKKIIDTMNEKIGKEKAALIADDIAKITSDNLQMNNTLKEKDTKISELTKSKEDLMATNMNLLQQIPMGDDESTFVNPKMNKKDENIENLRNADTFDFRTIFDENGNFKR